MKQWPLFLKAGATPFPVVLNNLSWVRSPRTPAKGEFLTYVFSLIFPRM